jgi:hypothetical protein
MRKLFWLLLFGPLALSGCARHYVITLTNGNQIGAFGKPQLKGGVYVFKDASGRDAYIGAGRVTEIAPASMMPNKKTMFKAKPAK